VERSILGNEPLFHVPVYHLVHPAELIGYAVLGLAGGVVSLIFCKAVLGSRAVFLRMPFALMWQPAIGGIAIGATLLLVPEVKGVGYEYVDQALNGGLVFRAMLILCLVKLVATVISYSTGNAGGIFGPSLFIGAMAGGAVGMVVNRVAPFPTGEPGAYALVGMGTLFAGIIRACWSDLRKASACFQWSVAQRRTASKGSSRSTTSRGSRNDHPVVVSWTKVTRDHDRPERPPRDESPNFIKAPQSLAELFSSRCAETSWKPGRRANDSRPSR
jgi:voltage-gated chloride channel